MPAPTTSTAGTAATALMAGRPLPRGADSRGWGRRHSRPETASCSRADHSHRGLRPARVRHDRKADRDRELRHRQCATIHESGVCRTQREHHRIEGSHIVVTGLYFHDNTNPPAGENARHEIQKLGAIYLGSRADSNVVRDCEFARSPVGIKVKGSYNLITRNHLHDATTPMGKNWGADRDHAGGPAQRSLVQPDRTLRLFWRCVRLRRWCHRGGRRGRRVRSA